MNKLIRFISMLALVFGFNSTSFSKVVGDKIILGAAVSLTGNILQMVSILKTGITWPLKE